MKLKACWIISERSLVTDKDETTTFMMLSLGEILLASDLEIKGLTITGEVSLLIMSNPMRIG